MPAPKKATTAAPKPAAKPRQPRKKVVEPEPEPEPEQEQQEVNQTPIEPEAEAETPSVDDTPSRGRRDVSAESIDAEFTSVLASLQEEFEAHKARGQTVGKFLRTLNKRVGQLQRDVRRVTKGKRRSPGTVSENSGFTRPLQISSELAKFLGVDSDTRLSRTEVTNRLAAYIRENNLKDSSNGRVVRPDKALTKLLGYKQKDCVDTTLTKKGEAKNPDGLLYYWVIQQLIQKHYVKDVSSE